MKTTTNIDADRYPSILHLLQAAMSKHSDAPAFKAFGQTLTYGDVDRLSRALAAYLQTTLGVQRGDRVAVMLPNLLAFPIAMLGILRAGAVQVNVNPLYTARELEHQLNDAEVQTIIVFNGGTSTLAEVQPRTGVKHVITVGLGEGSAATLPSPPIDARLGQAASFTEALAQGEALPLTPVSLSGDDLLFLQYTGGTTGPSKGAALTHRNLVANTEQFKAVMPTALVPGEEILVTAIPMYHIFALMVTLSYFSVGATNWLIANPRDIDGFVSVLQQARPSIFMGVNTLYASLVQHPRLAEVDWSRLKLAVGGGSAVIGATSERWRAITGTFIREGYGLSETSPVVSLNPEWIKDFTGTTGLPMPSTQVKLLNEHGAEAIQGEAGEICVKGPQVMKGYWKQPAANATAFTHDGYFRTGDIGVFDERGFLKVIDRKKDMVIVSGFNVYPNEVEAVASTCHGIGECACVGISDEKTGEAVKLFVVRQNGVQLSEADVIAHCRGGLAAYKVPKIVRFVETLPKSAVGKILRRELRSSI